MQGHILEIVRPGVHGVQRPRAVRHASADLRDAQLGQEHAAGTRMAQVEHHVKSPLLQELYIRFHIAIALQQPFAASHDGLFQPIGIEGDDLIHAGESLAHLLEPLVHGHRDGAARVLFF